jgi:hypothetical protein
MSSRPEWDAAHARLLAEVARWEGVTLAPHRLGGTEFRFGRGEIGHVHSGGPVDIAFPKPVRDAIVAAGEAEPHHVLPASGWVSVSLREPGDWDKALELLRRAHAIRIELKTARADDPPIAPDATDTSDDSRDLGTEPRSVEDALDEALDESFPASDPPAIGRH